MQKYSFRNVSKNRLEKILQDTSKLLENITKKDGFYLFLMRCRIYQRKKKNREKIELLKKEKLLKKILEIIPSSEILSIKEIEKKTIKDRK